MAPSKGVMLKKLPNVLQPLLRTLRMASQIPPPNIPGLFTGLKDTSAKTGTVELWYDTVFNNPETLNCHVHKVIHKKMSDGVAHEYLLFEIKFRDAGEYDSILIAERDMGDERESFVRGFSASQSCENKHRPYSSSFTSLSRFKAYDIIHNVTKPSPAYDKMAAELDKGYSLLTLSFGEIKPSVHELATLLRITSRNKPLYDAGCTQCFWFAATVFEALQRRFEGTVEDTNGHKRRGFHGVPIHIQDSVGEIHTEYEIARATWSEQRREQRFEDMRRELEHANQRADRAEEMIEMLRRQVREMGAEPRTS
ncbi:hypothetical protein EDD15DRAFT_794259 [Pisolithus albus]|nr:hypothetical protein EDD15DRAFT_794259 [Pisolithus albus]